MGAHRPDPLGISVTLMIWTTTHTRVAWPDLALAWPESISSMMPCWGCAMATLSERLRRPVQGKIHDEDEQAPR